MLDFEGAIFDLDGTLFESMDVWYEIDIEFLAKRGCKASPEYAAKIVSMTFQETAKYTIEYFGLNETVQEIMQEWFEMAIDRYSNQVRLKPRAKEYLMHLREQGVKLGTATSLPKVLAEPALRNNGVYHLFDAFASTDEVARGKEFPDVYLLAAKRLEIPPGRCVVFEDILPGLRAAKAAGMRPYGVFDQSSKHHESEMEELSEVFIRDFGELL